MRGEWPHPLSSNGKSCGSLLTQFATRRLAVEQYQSIDDTIVQLFSSSASVLITGVVQSVAPVKIMRVSSWPVGSL